MVLTLVVPKPGEASGGAKFPHARALAARDIEGALAWLPALKGALVEEAVFVISLPELGGQTRLEEQGIQVTTLVEFEGE